jgi:hypothetical protein
MVFYLGSRTSIYRWSDRVRFTKPLYYPWIHLCRLLNEYSKLLYEFLLFIDIRKSPNQVLIHSVTERASVVAYIEYSGIGQRQLKD